MAAAAAAVALPARDTPRPNPNPLPDSAATTRLYLKSLRALQLFCLPWPWTFQLEGPLEATSGLFAVVPLLPAAHRRPPSPPRQPSPAPGSLHHPSKASPAALHFKSRFGRAAGEPTRQGMLPTAGMSVFGGKLGVVVVGFRGPPGAGNKLAFNTAGDQPCALGRDGERSRRASH